MDKQDSAIDLKLLRDWRAGDAQAGSQLLRRHFSGLYRFFASRVEGEVAEFVQRTLLACVDSRDQVPEGVVFRAYLWGIARKQLLMHLRRSARADRVARAKAMQPLSSRLSPSGVVARNEDRRFLAQALRTLPLNQQIAIELYYWEQMSIADLAVVLEISPSAAKTWLYHARRALRASLEGLALRGGHAGATSEDLSRWVESMRGRVSPQDPMSHPQSE